MRVHFRSLVHPRVSGPDIPERLRAGIARGGACVTNRRKIWTTTGRGENLVQPGLSPAVVTVMAVTSLAFCVATSALWMRSYAPLGASGAPPGPHIAVPIPSDADNYAVAFRGSLEYWEYAPWSRTWYRMGGGAPLWALVVAFAAGPAVWYVRRARRRRLGENTKKDRT